MTEKTKIKMLFWGDFLSNTGFAQVSQNILRRLEETGDYDITIIGINYTGDPHHWSFRVYPADRPTHPSEIYRDVFGRQRVFDLLHTLEYDVLFSIQDPFILSDPIAQDENGKSISFGDAIKRLQKEMRKNKVKLFHWVHYYPVDCDLRDFWVRNGLTYVDTLVAYTEFGKEQTLRHTSKSVKVIPHGIDTKVFFPLEEADRKKIKVLLFGEKNKDKIVITNINKNQRRKDIPTTIQAFKLFKVKYPDSILYLHMAPDNYEGWDVRVIANDLGLEIGVDVLLPKMGEKGLPLDSMNAIYNVSDMVITTTLGEGWGLSITEAMACKVPVIAPNHTAITEISDNSSRFLTVDPSDTINWGIVDRNITRPKVNAEKFSEGMLKIENNILSRKEGIDLSYDYITKNLQWNELVKVWDKLFKEISIEKNSIADKIRL